MENPLASILVVSVLTGAIGYEYAHINTPNGFRPLYRWVAVGCVLSESDKYYLNSLNDIEVIEFLKSNQSETDLNEIKEEFKYFHDLEL